MAKPRRFPKHLAVMICQGCGSSLTEDENHYYGGRCEDCTRPDWQELQRWKSGEANEKFDRLYSAPKPTVH
jgi:predicted amidophosphoribosyltransferase